MGFQNQRLILFFLVAVFSACRAPCVMAGSPACEESFLKISPWQPPPRALLQSSLESLEYVVTNPQIQFPKTHRNYLKNITLFNHVVKAHPDLKGQLESIKTLLYPISGYDVSTPFELFPNLTTLILIDNHRAVDLFEFKKRKTSFEALLPHQIDRVGYVGFRLMGDNQLGYILGALKEVFSDLRVRSITLSENRNYRSRLKNVEVGEGTAYGPGVNALIHIRAFGKNRRIYYMNDFVSSERTDYWKALFSRIDFDALMLKGAMGTFEVAAPREMSLEDLAFKVGIRQILQHKLMKSKGLIVEGGAFINPEKGRWDQTRRYWEWTFEGPPEQVSYLVPIDKLFGYGGSELMVSVFQNPRDDARSWPK